MLKGRDAARCRGEGGTHKGLEVVTESHCQNKGFCSDFLNTGNFLTVTVLSLLNLAGEDG